MLPTPKEVFKGFWGVFQSFLFALVLFVVFFPMAQFAIVVVGLVLCLFHHWIIGVALCLAGMIAGIVRQNLKF